MLKKVNVPIFDLKKEYEFLKKEIDKELKECFESQQWILGKKVSQFEENVAQYLNIKYAVGVASGTDALLLSLRVLALRKKGKEYFDRKDEIITTPFTFIATSEAIVRSGATPVFVDIDPLTFNIDPLKVEKAITRNTVGILPVHLYGLACDMDKILKIAKEHDIFVLEDTAQAFGGVYFAKGGPQPEAGQPPAGAVGGKGKKLGTFGDLGAFSFFPSKNLGGFGDGGLIVTNCNKLAELIRILRNHGQNKRYKAFFIGYNSRLDSIQAAVLLAKLKHIDKFNKLRRKVATIYNQAFKNITEIQTPFVPKQSTHVYHLYTLKVSSKRDKFLSYLNSKGIGARIYYPLPLYKMKAFKGAKSKGPFKGVEEVLKKILSLPIYPFLEKDKIQYITRTISSFFGKGYLARR